MIDFKPGRKGERRYGQWAGNPKGMAQRPADCVEEVANGWLFAQCQRKRGHGPDGEYCKQHAKKIATQTVPGRKGE